MNKTVIVTGAAKGIGSAIALRFALENYNIVLNYRNGEPIELIQKIEELGAKVLPYKADVSNFNEARELAKFAKKQFEKIDVLVNNAGITRDSLLVRMEEDQFDEVININLKGAFNMLKHVSDIMLRQKQGAIINISSVVGINGNIGQTNYAASKAGLIGLTKSAAKELALRNITCNAVAPGFIETDMTAELSEYIKTQIMGKILLKRFGKADEVADLVYYLSNNSYITGQVISIDGGMTIN